MDNIENIQNNKKKMPTFIKAILIILAIIVSLSLIIVLLYKTKIGVADKYEECYDYDFNKQVIVNNHSIKDFLSYDSKTDEDNIYVDIDKTYFYKNILKIDDINNKLSNDYNLKINKIGTTGNGNNVDFYIDVDYKDSIKTFVSGTIEYRFTNENNIELYLTDLNIGDNIPKSIYSKFIPFNNGDLIYTLNKNKYEVLNNDLLRLDLIKDIKINKENITFKYNYVDNTDNIISYIFDSDTENIIRVIKPIMPMVLEIMIGSNKDEYINILSTLIPKLLEIILSK